MYLLPVHLQSSLSSLSLGAMGWLRSLIKTLSEPHFCIFEDPNHDKTCLPSYATRLYTNRLAQLS